MGSGAGSPGGLAGVQAWGAGNCAGARPRNFPRRLVASAGHDPLPAAPAASRLSQPARVGPFRPRWTIRGYQLASGRWSGPGELRRQRRVLGGAREHGKTRQRQELRSAQIPQQPHKRMGGGGRAGQTVAGLAFRCPIAMRMAWSAVRRRGQRRSVQGGWPPAACCCCAGPRGLRPFGSPVARGPWGEGPLMVGEDGQRGLK